MCLVNKGKVWWLPGTFLTLCLKAPLILSAFLSLTENYCFGSFLFITYLLPSEVVLVQRCPPPADPLGIFHLSKSQIKVAMLF